MVTLQRMAARGNENARMQLEDMEIAVDGFIWDMFSMLSISRQSGMGSVSGVSIRDIESMLNLHCIHDPDERLRHARILIDMDATWLRLTRARIEQESRRRG